MPPRAAVTFLALACAAGCLGQSQKQYRPWDAEIFTYFTFLGWTQESRPAYMGAEDGVWGCRFSLGVEGRGMQIEFGKNAPSFHVGGPRALDRYGEVDLSQGMTFNQIHDRILEIARSKPRTVLLHPEWERVPVWKSEEKIQTQKFQYPTEAPLVPYFQSLGWTTKETPSFELSSSQGMQKFFRYSIPLQVEGRAMRIQYATGDRAFVVRGAPHGERLADVDMSQGLTLGQIRDRMLEIGRSKRTRSRAKP